MKRTEGKALQLQQTANAILTLDVGLANCGYAVLRNDEVVACGVIRTKRSLKKTVRVADDSASRAASMARELRDIITNYKVKAIVGELPSGGAKSARAMGQMSAATAIVASVASILDIPTEYCTPTDCKLAACGSRSASKEDVMLAIRERFNNGNFPKAKAQFEHIADALAAYLALRHDGSLIKLLIN